MEDSTGMTIEFLRARLLSERSVSRTAKQRADELAKRVVELEEQLKIVSLQRKKAEKATENVLSILENHGIYEFSEEFDLSSEQEVTNRESKVGNGFPKEEESLGDSKMRRNHMDELSSSEFEYSSSPGRSLSWKGGKHSPHSQEKKYVDSATRRRNTFASTASASLKHRVGKSCRQIQRRETRSVDEESQIDSRTLAHQDKGIDACSEGSSTFSDIGPEILRGSPGKQDANILHDGLVSGHFEYQRLVSNAGNYLNIHGSCKEMERALEHQAQLIGQYEEEEKAQREWEEKFEEDNNTTQDFCEPGNRSDVTEERDETKAHDPPSPVATNSSKDQDTNFKGEEDVCFTKESSRTQSDGFQSPPRVDVGYLQDQKSSAMLAHESPSLDYVLPAAGKQDPQHSGNYHHLSCSEGTTENQSAQIVPSHADSSLSERENLQSKNEQYVLITCEPSDKVGSVLEALQQAKLSLKGKLNSLPSVDGGGSIGKAIEHSVVDRPEVPVGCAGLFRVPSDFFPSEASTKGGFLGSNSQLSLTNYYPDAEGALKAGDHAFITSCYTESRSIASAGDRRVTDPTSLHMERRPRVAVQEPLETTWSRFSSPKPIFGPTLDMGIPFSNRSTYNDPNRDTGFASSITYASPTYLFSPDLMPIPRMTSNDGMQPFLSGGAGVNPGNHLSFNDDCNRLNMNRL